MKTNAVVHFEIHVTDMARAAEYGGSIVQENQSIGEHGFCALAHDTEGNLIGLHSMK